MLSIPLYHESRTFKFINTSAFQECAFVLGNVKSLKSLPLESTNFMCSSIFNKYIKRLNSLSNISPIQFVANYGIIANVNKNETNVYNLLCSL